MVQEAFIKSYRNLSSLKERSNFKTWFCRILINEAFKRLQKMGREVIFDAIDNLSEVGDASETFRGLNQEEQIMLVSESLKEIPARESLSLQLFYLEGNNIDQISNLMGWSEANVKVILHRARKHLLEVVSKKMGKDILISIK